MNNGRMPSPTASLFTTVAVLAMIGSGQVAVAKEGTWKMAAGLRWGFLQREDFGQGVSERILLEPTVHGYVPLPLGSLYLRPSLHASYVWDQAEMPVSIRVEESDLYAGAGLGLLWDWIVVPALEGGAQVIFRTLSLESGAPVEVDEDLISNSETLMAYYVQFGLGLPFFEGFFVAEPFYRLRFVDGDDREGVTYGLEFSFELF